MTMKRLFLIITFLISMPTLASESRAHKTRLAEWQETDNIYELTNQSEINQFLKDHNLVIIEFYNPECPVCQEFRRKGIFQASADALTDVTFAMANIFSIHDASVKATPTFLLYKDGKEIKRFEGYVETRLFIRKLRNIFQSAGAKLDSKPKQKEIPKAKAEDLE